MMRVYRGIGRRREGRWVLPLWQSLGGLVRKWRGGMHCGSSDSLCRRVDISKVGCILLFRLECFLCSWLALEIRECEILSGHNHFRIS
jgi:hypothetical protein